MIIYPKFYRLIKITDIFGVVSPFIPRSKMKPLIYPSSSFAQTTNTSAIGELVIHVFVPLITQYPSLCFACVFIPAGSEPASGSVNPKHPTNSPLESPGINLSLYSLLPQ